MIEHLLKFIFLCSLISYRVDGEDILDLEGIRAFIQVPFSAEHQLSKAKILFCKINKVEKNCNTVLLSIPLLSLRVDGKWQLEFDKDSKLSLSIKNSDTGSSEIFVTTQSFSGSWYPASEICSREGAEPACHYELSRDSKSKSLSIRIRRNF